VSQGVPRLGAGCLRRTSGVKRRGSEVPARDHGRCGWLDRVPDLVRPVIVGWPAIFRARRHQPPPGVPAEGGRPIANIQ